MSFTYNIGYDVQPYTFQPLELEQMITKVKLESAGGVYPR